MIVSIFITAMSVNLIRAYVRNMLSNLQEGRQKSITGQEMVRAIERLSNELRDMFPDVAFPVTKAGEKILPFSPKKIWTKYPPVFLRSEEEIIFGLHLGDGYSGNVPNENELISVVEHIKSFMKNRGWYVFNWETQSRGETLRIEIYPDVTGGVEVEGDHLYHLTDKKNLSSILSKGLTPSTSKDPNRGYGQRVYLFSDKGLLDQQIKQNKDAHSDSGGWNSKLTSTPDMSVVVIDSKKLRRNTKLRRDPEFGGDKGAIYTFTHVPPEAIDHVYDV